MEHLGLKYGQLYIDHELAVRSAFQDLLSSCAHKIRCTLVPEFSIDPHHEEGEQAVEEFSERLPEIAQALSARPNLP